MKRRIAFLALMGCGLSFMGLSNIRTDPTLLYNRTESAPIGWYRIERPNSYSVGDQVASRLPDEVQKLAEQRKYLPAKAPIIKTVFAGPGDRYCVRRSYLIVRDADRFEILTADSSGREMPALAGGCRRLSVGEYLLLSHYSVSSFDSRYFGPVDETDIIGEAIWMGKPGGSSSGKSLEEGGARGAGAEGKIKGPCTKLVLSPCLHINFGCTKIFGLAPQIRKTSNVHRSRALHKFTIRHDLSFICGDG